MSKPYDEGSLWRITFVKVKSGKLDLYMSDVLPLRREIMEKAIKAGDIISHKALNGLSANRDDWDVMFMVEYPNWASIDTLRDKLEALNDSTIGGHEKVSELVDKRHEVREVIGEKFMREVSAPWLPAS